MSHRCKNAVAPATAVSSLKLSAEGPRVSRVALGLWRLADWGLDAAGLRTLIEQCLDLGITTFDHADIYGDYSCEQRFGEALALKPSLRNRMQLITKCGIKLVSGNRPSHQIKHYDTSRAHIVDSVETSLRLLRTDYVDVLLIHRPDVLMDADEVAEAFQALRRAGKLLHVGVSNFAPSQFELLASRLDVELVTNQLEISVAHIDAFLDGSLDLCQRRRVSPTAWSPLGGGRLFTGSDDRSARLREALTAVGHQLGGATLDEVALAWLLTHPARIVPVLGTGKFEHIRAAVRAETLRLSREQWFTLWCASTGKEVP
jgi:predicted oxidoreductase